MTRVVSLVLSCLSCLVLSHLSCLVSLVLSCLSCLVSLVLSLLSCLSCLVSLVFVSCLVSLVSYIVSLLCLLSCRYLSSSSLLSVLSCLSLVCSLSSSLSSRLVLSSVAKRSRLARVNKIEFGKPAKKSGTTGLNRTDLRSMETRRAGNQSAPAEEILRPATSSCGTPATSTSVFRRDSHSNDVS